MWGGSWKYRRSVWKSRLLDVYAALIALGTVRTTLVCQRRCSRCVVCRCQKFISNHRSTHLPSQVWP
jgi:hypothetical protein